MISKIRMIPSRFLQTIRKISILDAAILAVACFLAFLIRLSLHDYYTRDFSLFTNCYQTIRSEGWTSFKTGCTNYSPLYEYILYLENVLFPFISNTAGTKIPGIGFDFICAWYAHLIVRLKYKSGPLPFFAFFAVLFSPTLIINSAAWGQFDGIYTTFLLASLYYILKKRSWSACLTFGIAISFKFQAVTLAPLFLVLLFKHKISWKALLLVPAVYLFSIIPAWFTGRSLVELLTIYVTQVDLFKMLTLNAPNLYAWVPENTYDQFYLAGFILGVSIIFIYIIAVQKSRVELTSSRIILFAMISVLMVPYFLPKMHERYFLPADVLAIVFAFYYPAYFYFPIIIGLVSFFASELYLFQESVISLPILALVLLVMIVLLARKMLLELYPGSSEASGKSKALVVNNKKT
jgi:Gpi18-like mannosyltransferase